MGSLLFITALRLDTTSESENGFTLINLDTVREVHHGYQVFNMSNSIRMNNEDIKNKQSTWLVHEDMLPSYDMFISHRWHKKDDELIDLLYDAFLGQIVGSEMRAVKIFYDKIRLKGCQQFQKTFVKALINSTILVPILCTTALQRMITHDASCEDNVLIEWMLALECMLDPIHSKVRGIYPLMFGERNFDGSLGDLFSEGVIDRLPDVVPTASIEVAQRLLEENGFTVSTSLATQTVREVVKEISKYIGLKGWEYPNRFICAASEAIVKRLEYYLNSTQNNSDSIS